MSANTVNRETVRDEFASILSTALVGDGLPVKEVVGYRSGIITKSPTIEVASSGTARQKLGVGYTKKFNNFFCLEVFAFVRDADATNGWTEAQVEDLLDLLDKKIADVVGDNLVNQYWLNISFALDTENPVPEMSEIFEDTQRGMIGEMRKLYFQKVDN